MISLLTSGRFPPKLKCLLGAHAPRLWLQGSTITTPTPTRPFPARQSSFWSAQEIEILKQGVAERHTYKRIAQKLDRNIWACYQKAYYLGITEQSLWSEEEIGILIDARARKEPYGSIARKLNRTIWACGKQARNLGITEQRLWSEEEIGILIDARTRNEPYGKIARKLNRTRDACRVQAGKLGITNPRKSLKWSADE